WWVLSAAADGLAGALRAAFRRMAGSCRAGALGQPAIARVRAARALAVAIGTLLRRLLRVLLLHPCHAIHRSADARLYDSRARRVLDDALFLDLLHAVLALPHRRTPLLVSAACRSTAVSRLPLQPPPVPVHRGG